MVTPNKFEINFIFIDEDEDWDAWEADICRIKGYPKHHKCPVYPVHDSKVLQKLQKRKN